MGIETAVLQALYFLASVAYQQVQTAKLKKKQDKMKGLQFTRIGEAASIPLVYGRQRLGGIQVTEKVTSSYTSASETGSNVFDYDFGTASQTGSKNEFLTTQYVIAREGINQVKYLKVNGQDYDNAKSKFNHRIRCFTSGGTADPVATANGLPSTNLFTNCSFATSHFKLNRDEQNYSGIPEMGFLVEGNKIRSVIRSGTAPNYTYAMDTSYTYSNNPAYCLLDYLLNAEYGRGLTVDYVDLESFYNAAQLCDTVVMSDAAVGGKMFGQPRVNTVATYSELPSTLEEQAYPNDLWLAEDTGLYWEWTESGGTWQWAGASFGAVRDIPLYECNIAIDTSRSIRENIIDILGTMGQAELTYTTEGKYKLCLAYPTNDTEMDALIPSSLYFNKDNIINDSFNISFPNAQERLNQCTVRFLNEHNDFKEDTATWPTVGSTPYTTYLSEDNGVKHHADIPGVGITDPYHALAKAEQEVRKSRSIFTVSFTTNKEGLVLEPGDFIKVTLDESDLNEDIFRVESIKVNEDFSVSISAYFYDYNTLTWNIADDVDYIIPPDYDYVVSQPTNVSFTPSDSNISGFTTGYVSWTAADDIAVRDYVVYISTDNTNFFELGTTRNTYFDIGNVISGTYYFGVRSRTALGKLSSLVVSASSSVPATNLAFVNLLIFKRATSTPSTPTGGVYNWETGTITTVPTGWSTTVTAGSDPLYVSTVSISTNNPADTSHAISGWASPAILAQNGVDGVDGTDGADGVTGKSVYTGVIYIRSSSTPAAPTGGSFNFGTNTLTPPSGWSLSVPSGSNPVYATRYVFSIIGDTGSVTAGTWVTPFKVAENGQDGLDGSDGLSTYNAIIYRRSSTTPSTPTGGSYDFGTNNLTPATGWSRTIPSGTDPVYTTSALASVVGTTGTDITLTWFTPYELVRNGVNGVDGLRGAGWWRYEDTTNASSYYATSTQSRVNSAFSTATGTSPVEDDRFIISCTDTAIAYIYSSANWVTQAAFIDGNLLVNGTITSDKVETDFIDAFSINADNITTGTLVANRLAINGSVLTVSGGNLTINSNGIERSFIQDNAVSNGGYVSSTANTYANDATTSSFTAGLALTLDQFWNFGVRVVYRAASRTSTYLPKPDYYNNVTYYTRPVLDLRQKVSGSWGSWSEAYVFPAATGESYVEKFYSFAYINDIDDVELRLRFEVYLGNTSQGAQVSEFSTLNVDSTTIVGRAVVR